MGEVLAAKKRLDEVYAAYAEPDADFDALAAEQAQLEAIIAARGRRLGRADGNRRRRAAAAAVGREDRPAVGRREAPRRAVPAAAVEARHAAARRADQPPRCRERRMARAVPAEVSRHRDRRHARSLLPRQRRRVDPRARPRLRHSVEGQLHVVARAEGAAAAARSQAGGRAHQGDAEGARVGAHEPQGPPGEEQGAHRALRGAVVVRAPEAQRDAGDLHPGRRAARQRGDRVPATSARATATGC